MSDDLREVPGDTLERITRNVNNAELHRRLNEERDPERPALSTHAGKNFALFETDVDTPDTELMIIRGTDDPPDGAKEICDGELTIGGSKVAVKAYRLA